MPLFRSGRDAAAPDTDSGSATDEQSEATSPGKGPGGKGRPTPKRREAQRRRREAVKAPATRKEAYRQRRSTIKSERRRQRAALATGDERNLPARDAGPVKRFVRDLVDSRLSLASFFLPAALVLLVASTVHSSAVAAVVSFGYVALLGAILVDSFLLARLVKARVAEKFGEKETHGVRMYAVTRALQFRRLRMPPPKVKRGGRPV